MQAEPVAAQAWQQAIPVDLNTPIDLNQEGDDLEVDKEFTVESFIQLEEETQIIWSARNLEDRLCYISSEKCEEIIISGYVNGKLAVPRDPTELGRMPSTLQLQRIVNMKSSTKTDRSIKTSIHYSAKTTTKFFAGRHAVSETIDKFFENTQTYRVIVLIDSQNFVLWDIIEDEETDIIIFLNVAS
uniref:Uncharacterized protein n=1 Tax=Romanomermis culicivorax TaxID=13658 RepID=A0A915HQL3_ROMCU